MPSTTGRGAVFEIRQWNDSRWFAHELSVSRSLVMNRLVARLVVVALIGFADACTAYRIARYRQPDALNMGMFAKRIVGKAEAPYAFARVAEPRTDLDTVTVRREDGARTSFRRYMDEHAVLAFLVVRNDTILYETYRGGLTDSTVHSSFSVAKSFLSALVGIALGEGKIRSLDDPISDYVSELRGRPAFDGVTVRHLIAMRSGLRFTKTGNGVWADFRSDEAHAYYTTDLPGWLAGVPRIDAPGSTWRYKDTDAELLGLVLSRATGMTVSAYMEARLWRLIGTEHDASWDLDHANGQERVASGFNAVARDYARFGRLFLEGGVWAGVQVVPSQWVAQSVAIDSTRSEPEISTWWKMQHTLYWWHPIQPPTHDFFADGSHGQRIYVDPATRMIIVQLANDSRQDFPFRKIVAYLNGQSWEYPRSIPVLVRQAAMAFGADSAHAVFERLVAAERNAPAHYVITRRAMDSVVNELLGSEKTRAAGLQLRDAVNAYYARAPAR